MIGSLERIEIRKIQMIGSLKRIGIRGTTDVW